MGQDEWDGQDEMLLPSSRHSGSRYPHFTKRPGFAKRSTFSM